MTERIFEVILNMSLTAGIVILAVMLVRLALKRAPKIFSYCLWAVVGFRLLCPISFTSSYSLLGILNMSPAAGGAGGYFASEALRFGDARTQPAAEPGIGNGDPQEKEQETGRQEKAETGLTMLTHTGTSGVQDWLRNTGKRIWIAGMAFLAVYSAVKMARLRRKLRGAVHERDNIYVMPGMEASFVYGLVRPRIYLPDTLEAQERKYILMHEQIHIRRGDHIVKCIAFLALCLHWFNPLVWAAFFLCGKDMEMSCDEAVIRRFGNSVKRNYSASLLNMAAGRRMTNGIPLAFGGGDTGGRIRNVLRYKKPAIAVLCGAVALTLLVSVALLANPAAESRAAEDEGQSSRTDYYGVIMEIENGADPARTVVRIPGLGDVEIPEAKQVAPYIEYDFHGLEPGDLVWIVFPEGTVPAIQETYPARFTDAAEEIWVIGQGMELYYEGDGKYRYTFPRGRVPEEAAVGDVVEIWSNLLSDSQASLLIASAPILALEESGKYTDAPTATIALSEEEITALLSSFPSGVGYDLTDGVSSPDPGAGSAEGEEMPEALEVDYRGVSIRTISRSARCIDNYIAWGAEEKSSYDGGEELAFAENCVFRINYRMDGVQYTEVDFDTFADVISESDPWLNKPCMLTFEDGLIVRADLMSAYDNYGIRYSEMTAYDAEGFLSMSDEERQNILRSGYLPATAQTADIADTEGMETVQVFYDGGEDVLGDGAGDGIVLFFDRNNTLLHVEYANESRAGWNNVYIGEVDGRGFIMTVGIEDRDDFGEYSYHVFRLGDPGYRAFRLETAGEADGQDRILNIAGSTFSWGGNVVYDDDLFRQWVSGMEYYLANSVRVLSTQDGVLDVSQVSDADRYNYETLKRSGN